MIMDAPIQGSKDHVKSGINSNTTLGLSPEVVALSSGLSPGYLSQHPPPGLSHLRTTYLHLYSYLVITASSLRSHLGITVSSFGLSPRHHSIIPRLLCSLLWLLTCVTQHAPLGSPVGLLYPHWFVPLLFSLPVFPGRSAQSLRKPKPDFSVLLGDGFHCFPYFPACFLAFLAADGDAHTGFSRLLLLCPSRCLFNFPDP